MALPKMWKLVCGNLVVQLRIFSEAMRSLRLSQVSELNQHEPVFKLSSGGQES